MPCHLSRSELVDEIARLRAELRNSRREVHHLRIENEILRDAAEPLIHHAPARERLVFIHARRDRFSIRRLCQVLVTDHSDYHAWVRAREVWDRRGYDDRELAQWILEIPRRVRLTAPYASLESFGAWASRLVGAGWPG